MDISCCSEKRFSRRTEASTKALSVYPNRDDSYYLKRELPFFGEITP